MGRYDEENHRCTVQVLLEIRRRREGRGQCHARQKDRVRVLFVDLLTDRLTPAVDGDRVSLVGEDLGESRSPCSSAQDGNLLSFAGHGLRIPKVEGAVVIASSRL